MLWEQCHSWADLLVSRNTDRTQASAISLHLSARVGLSRRGVDGPFTGLRVEVESSGSVAGISLTLIKAPFLPPRSRRQMNRRGGKCHSRF